MTTVQGFDLKSLIDIRMDEVFSKMLIYRGFSKNRVGGVTTPLKRSISVFATYIFLLYITVFFFDSGKDYFRIIFAQN